MARRIGDGELTAIGVLTELADVEQEYFSQNHHFAQKIVSDEGQHNGLYWTVAEGQPASPLGPLADVAKALGVGKGALTVTTAQPVDFSTRLRTTPIGVPK